MSLRVLDSAARKLDIDLQTRDEAKKIFLKASQCTRPGTGHPFSYGPDALAAICVLLASNKLGNNAVSKEQARVSTALEPTRFDHAQTIVKRALSSSEMNDVITFMTLAQRYDVPQDHVVSMVEVRDHLERYRRAESTTRAMQCVIFYWVQSEIFKMDTPTKSMIQQDFRIPSRIWETSWCMVETQCTELKKQQIKHAQDNASHRRTRSQTTNNRSQPFSFTVKLPVTPNRTASNSGLKRKAPLDNLQESPSPLKRLKGAPPLPPGVLESPERQTPSKYNIPQKVSVIQIISRDEESGDETATEAIVVTPRKGTNYTAWEAARPSTLRQAELKTPSAKTELVTSTPATSLWMSSPTLPLKKKSPKEKTPVIHFEELSRRQRRNLCAPFLDPGVYAWRPGVGQVQKWETLIISKYGDSWDDL